MLSQPRRLIWYPRDSQSPNVNKQFIYKEHPNLCYAEPLTSLNPLVKTPKRRARDEHMQEPNGMKTRDYEQPSHDPMYQKCTSRSILLFQRRPSCSGMMHIGNPFDLAPRVERMPNRRNTSEHVTKIERTMRTMIIHVRPARMLISSSLLFTILGVTVWERLTGHLVVRNGI